jgi:hypothetical protein
VASDASSAPVYDADSGEMLGVLVRGSQVAYVPADLEQPREDGRVRIVNGEDSYVLLDAARLTDDPAKTVQVDIVYALRGMSLLDETGAVPGCAVEKGMALTVIGFDGLDADGNVLRWKVSCDRGEGYIADANIRMTEPEAQAQYDEALYQLHAARGDSWGGGDAAGTTSRWKKAPSQATICPTRCGRCTSTALLSNTRTTTSGWRRAAASMPLWWTSWTAPPCPTPRR